MNTVIEQVKEIPTFTVTSTNWVCEVKLNDFNQQFDITHQVMESASIALSVFKGLRSEPPLIMMSDARDQRPLLGTSLLVNIKGQPVEGSALVFSHVVLANIGAYQDSMKMQKVLEQQAEQIGQKLAAENAQKKLNKGAIDNKLFDALREKTFPTKETKTHVPKKVTKTPRKIRKGK